LFNVAHSGNSVVVITFICIKIIVSDDFFELRKLIGIIIFTRTSEEVRVVARQRKIEAKYDLCLVISGLESTSVEW